MLVDPGQEFRKADTQGLVDDGSYKLPLTANPPLVQLLEPTQQIVAIKA